MKGPSRLAAAGVVVVSFVTGCTQTLPARPAPAPSFPRDVELPADAPVAGNGRVVLDADEKAKVVEITGSATASAGQYTATIVGVRPLCTTPCVLDLPYGTHPLVLQSTTDPGRQSAAEIDVGPRAKVFRHALGERRPGGFVHDVGTTLVGLGIVAAATGAILWAVGSSNTSGDSLASTGRTLTLGGAAGVVVGLPLILLDRPTERPGSTTEFAFPSTPHEDRSVPNNVSQSL